MFEDGLGEKIHIKKDDYGFLSNVYISIGTRSFGETKSKVKVKL